MFKMSDENVKRLMRLSKFHMINIVVLLTVILSVLGYMIYIGVVAVRAFEEYKQLIEAKAVILILFTFIWVIAAGIVMGASVLLSIFMCVILITGIVMLCKYKKIYSQCKKNDEIELPQIKKVRKMGIVWLILVGIFSIIVFGVLIGIKDGYSFIIAIGISVYDVINLYAFIKQFSCANELIKSQAVEEDEIV